MCNRLYTFLSRALWRIAAVFSLAVFSMNLFFHSTVSYDSHEKVTISGYLLPCLAMLALVVCVFLIVAYFRKQMEKIHQGWLFILFCAVYIGIAAYIICNSNHVICADAMLVYESALAFRAGDTTSFQPGGYLYSFPHQLGLVCYDVLLSYIAETPTVLFAVNVVLALGSNFTCWKISQELSRNRLVHLFALLFSFAFLPQLFFVMFAYGLLPGWFLLQISFYHTLRFCRTNSWKNALGMLVFVAAAILIRSNNLIGAIAIILYLLLQQLHMLDKRKMTAVIAVVLCMIIPGRIVQGYFETRSGSQLNQGTPSVLWIAMGTDIDNRTLGPGWYDGTTYLAFGNGLSKSEASALGNDMLRQNVDKIKQDPVKASLFFCDKLLSTWCDPLYQSIWSGPKPAFGQSTNTPLLMSLYGDGKAENLAEHYAKLLSLTIWIGICLFLLFDKATSNGWQLAFAYFVGGFLFHILWETKSQYVYPYVFGLIPFAACGFHHLMNRLAPLNGTASVEGFSLDN